MKNVVINPMVRRIFEVVIKTTDNKAVYFQRCFSTEAGLKEKTSSSNVSPEDPEWKAAKPFEQMPGYRNLPILGTLWVMLPVVGAGFDLAHAIDMHRSAYKQFGIIRKDHFPGVPPIITTYSPEDAERLFRSEGKYPNRPSFQLLQKYRSERVEYYTSTGMLPGSGESWWKVRSKAQQPFLKTKNVNNYLPVLNQIGNEFIDRIRLIRKPDNEVKPDFINEMYRWALESVAVVGLNTRLGCLDPNLNPDSEAQKMINAANTSFTTSNKLEFGLPFWRFFKTPMLKQLYEAQDFFTATAIKYLNKTLDDIKKRPADSEEDPSILEELLLRGMSKKDAIVIVVDMLMAGIDTTSHSVSFLLYHLAKNPEKQEKLRKEILSVIGPKGSSVTVSALNELHYLKACIKETMRLLPVLSGNARVMDRDLVLSGYRVPKGAMVVVMHQVMGELEEYFPNPKSYIPERWIKGDPQESHHHPYTLLPFGFGTRMCIGRRLAELEMWQLTAKVMQNFKVEYHHKDIQTVIGAVNTPDQPLRFKFIDLA